LYYKPEVEVHLGYKLIGEEEEEEEDITKLLSHHQAF
jgi:hypothetical protein